MAETKKDQEATAEAAALRTLIKDLEPEGKALLVTSFHETVKLVQSYMLSGLGSSFFFVVLAFSGAANLTIQAPAMGSSVPVSTNLALTLALAIYWAAGSMCTLLVDRVRRISLVLHYAAPSLHIAAHSFPSVVLLRSYGPRLGLGFCLLGHARTMPIFRKPPSKRFPHIRRGRAAPPAVSGIIRTVAGAIGFAV